MSFTRILGVCAAVAFVASVAGTSLAKLNVDPAISAQISAVASALNAGNASALKNAFTADAVIVDEFPPFKWAGAGAGVVWFTDFSAFAKKLKISAAHATPHDAKYYEHDAKTAYVVVPTDFKYAVSGKPAAETGAWTFVFVKRGGRLKIASMTWAKTGV